MMGIGGLLAKAFDMKSRQPGKHCERCGLQYPGDQEHCVHCSDLDDRALAHMKERLVHEQEAHKNLGRKFGILALILLVLLLLSFN